MDTQVRTPQAIFMQPQRLLVPLFQRPYVWNEELQWEPLWRDIERVAGRLLENPNAAPAPHFLGALVLQQLANRTSDLQQRTVIDGQQRLTTLQLLLDAVHTCVEAVGATTAAARLEPLTANAAAFCRHPEDRFKVWPTNRDRAAFNEVMAAPSPIDYQKLTHRAARMVKAHEYFTNQCSSWLLAQGVEQAQVRADAIERSARELLQVVVIDLNANENAQEIFETLNARGAVLTAADLIKNFVFQRLLEKGADVEKAYKEHWEQFETAFWETEVNVGRLNYPRSAAFLNHWLIARTGEEIVAREVFTRFKTYVDFDASVAISALLQDVNRGAAIYRDFTERAEIKDGPLDRLGLFSYRLKTMESEVIKPVLLALLDHAGGKLPESELSAALDILESWLTRRMLVRATAKSYNKVLAEVVALIRGASPATMGQTLRSFFSSQTTETAYWPDDDEVRRELLVMPVYRRLSRARLRMVLEAIEDHWRGWVPGQESSAGMRIRRGSYHIEHLMPQSWGKNWPLTSGIGEHDRDARLHRLGNLTLLTRKLNSKVSNGPWLGNGEQGKVWQLQQNDVVLLNGRLLKEYSTKQWDEDGIDKRTTALINTILAIWPTPAGHKVDVSRGVSTGAIGSVELADLIGAGLLTVGQTLYSRQGNHAGNVARVLSDGRIEVGAHVFDSPSMAAIHVRKTTTNGWNFWRLEPNGTRRLHELRIQYLRLVAPGQDSDDDDDAEETD